MDTWEPLVLE
jgi:hypothetical protein